MNKLKKILQAPGIFCFNIKYQKMGLFQRSLLLATLPRSGTHYSRALIANYLQATMEKPLLHVDQASREHHFVFEKDVFNTKSSISSIKITEQNLKTINKSMNIIRTHQPYHQSMKHFRKVHLYREPISFFESAVYHVRQTRISPQP